MPGVVVAVDGFGAQGIALGHQAAVVVVGLVVLGAVGVDLAHQPGLVVVLVHLLAAVGVVHRDGALPVPLVAGLQARHAGPVAHAADLLAFALPFPVERRAACQPPLEDDVGGVVAVALALVQAVAGLGQLPGVVVVVAGQGRHAHPGRLLAPLRVQQRLAHLQLQRHQAAALVRQVQAVAGAVVDVFQAAGAVMAEGEAIVVGVAQGDQPAVDEMQVARALAGFGDHQFTLGLTEEDRRVAQAVADEWAAAVGHREAGAAVLVVAPHHALAVGLQLVAQAVAPAGAQAVVDLGRAGAVHPHPGQRQHAEQLGILQREQLLAGDHRHRATVGDGLVGALGGLVAGGAGLAGGVGQVRFRLHPQRRLALAAHHRDGVVHHHVELLRGALDGQRHLGRAVDLDAAARQQRLGQAGMGRQGVVAAEVDQPLQAAEQVAGNATRVLEALGGQPERQAQATGQHDAQQHVQQQAGVEHGESLGLPFGWGQGQPLQDRGGVEEHQQLVVEHQVGGVQQAGRLGLELLEVRLADVLQQLVAGAIEVEQQLDQGLEVVEQVRQHASHALVHRRVDVLQTLRGAHRRHAVPVRADALGPLAVQPALELVEQTVVGAVQRLDLGRADLGVEQQCIAAVGVAAADGGPAMFVELALEALRGLAWRHLLHQRVGRAADGHEGQALEAVHDVQHAIGRAIGVAGDRARPQPLGLAQHLVALAVGEAQLLLQVQRPAQPQAVLQLFESGQAVLAEMGDPRRAVGLAGVEVVVEELGVDQEAHGVMSLFTCAKSRSMAGVSSGAPRARRSTLQRRVASGRAK